MNISIRKFLLLNLLLAVTITTTVTVVGNYYLDQRDIQQHLDSLLLQSSLAFETLIGSDIQERDMTRLQTQINKIPMLASHLFRNGIHGLDDRRYLNSFQFQVWRDDGKLLLHSANAPKLPLSDGTPGFSDKFINEHQWRVYTIYNAKLGLNIVVAERYDIRNELVRRIAIDDFYIMLWTYPFSGLLIWIIIGRGLDSLRRVAREVAYRDPSNLDPVNAETVPMEIKPLVDELNKLFLRLQEALEREKRFAGDAAHELRTPLAALRAQAQLALKAEDEQERLATLKNVIACVDRSTHVVQQLLTLSRLVPEATSIDDTHPTDLNKLAAEVIAQLVPQALNKNIEIDLDAADKPAMVKANATALSILMRNLIDNAIRYTPENGEVHTSVKIVGEKVILKVADTGPGIPPELRARVFERFFRVLGNKTTGSGLGLAIVQQIARLHNAEVKLGSPSSGIGLEIEVTFKKL